MKPLKHNLTEEQLKSLQLEEEKMINKKKTSKEFTQKITLEKYIELGGQLSNALKAKNLTSEYQPHSNGKIVDIKLIDRKGGNNCNLYEIIYENGKKLDSIAGYWIQIEVEFILDKKYW